MKKNVRHPLIVGLEIIALVIALCVGLLFLTQWRLSQGGVSLGLIRGHVESYIAAQLEEGTNVSVETIVLHWDASMRHGDGPLRLVVTDFNLTNAASKEVASFPTVAFLLGARDVLRWRLLPRSIEVFDASLVLSRDMNRMYHLGIRTPISPASIPEDTSVQKRKKGEALIRSVLGHRLRDGTTLFEKAVLRRANLSLTDSVTDQTWLANNVTAEVSWLDAGYVLSLETELSIEDHKTPFRLQARLDEGGTQWSAEVAFAQLPASDLLRFMVDTQAVQLAGVKIDGNVNLGGTLDGRIRHAHFDLHAAGGTASIKEHALPIDAIAIRGTYLSEESQLQIEELQVISGESRGAFTGVLRGVQEEGKRDLHPMAFVFELAGRDVHLALPKSVLPDTIVTSDFVLRGQFKPSISLLTIESLDAGVYDERLTGMLEIDMSEGAGVSVGVTADMQIKGTLQPTEILSVWPMFLANGARTWIDKNILDGNISNIDFQMNLPAGALHPQTPLNQEAMQLAFDLEKTSATYVAGMTPLTNIIGKGVVRGNSFVLEMESGNIGRVKIVKGEVDIPAFLPRAEPAYYRADVKGEIRDILAIIDEPPLGFVRQAGIAPDDFSGTARFSFELMRPMQRVVPADAYRFNGRGTFVDATIQHPFSKKDIVAHDGVVILTDDGIRIQSDAMISQMPVHVDWFKSFEKNKGTRTFLHGKFDTVNAEKMGFPVSEIVQGDVLYKISVHELNSKIQHINVVTDWDQVKLTIPSFNWEKEKGVPATLHFNVIAPLMLTDQENSIADVWQVHGISAQSENLEMMGAMSIARDGRVTWANFPRIFLKNSVDAGLLAERTQDQTLKINLDGKFLHAGRFVDWFMSRQVPEKPPASAMTASSRYLTKYMEASFDLNVKLAALELRDVVRLQTFTATARQHNGHIRHLNVAGEFANGHPLSLRLEEETDTQNRTIKFMTDDFGVLYRGLLGSRAIGGGQAVFESILLSNGPVMGRLNVSDARLHNTPLIARVFSSGSIAGLNDLVQGEGIELSTVQADLTLVDGSLAIRNARATGPSIGASLEGNVDVQGGTCALSGALAPVYQFNSVFGKIPGLGEMLVSRKGEGVVAFSYQVSGPTRDPKIVVNPLSLLTPGFLRRIFEPRYRRTHTAEELLNEAILARESARQHDEHPTVEMDASPAAPPNAHE